MIGQSIHVTKIKMAQPTKPGNTERGWNDPPMFLHTPVAGAPPTAGPSPGKRNPLNKRVAHPGLYGEAQATGVAPPTMPPVVPPPATLQPAVNDHSAAPPLIAPPLQPVSDDSASSSSSSSHPPLSVILLPPTMSTDLPRFTAPIIVPTMSPTEKDCPILGSPVATNPVTNMPVNLDLPKDDLNMPNFDNDQQLYHYVVTRLQKTLLDCKHTLKPREEDDARKRLGLMACMWDKGELSYPVKSSMARLATALHRRRCDLADQIHLALMFDHVSEVSQWMVGVKRLIREARTTAPPVCPSDSSAEDLALQKRIEEARIMNDEIAKVNEVIEVDNEVNNGDSNEQTKDNSVTQRESSEQAKENQVEHIPLDTNENDTSIKSELAAPAILPVSTEQVNVASAEIKSNENCDINT